MNGKARIAAGAVAAVAIAMTASSAAESAPSVAPASAKFPAADLPAAAPADGMGGRGGLGQVQIDDRVYAAAPGSCITLPAPDGGIPPGTRAVSNGTGQTIAIFAGPQCAGVPTATVGPNSSSFGVGPAGSFRVLNVN